MSLKFKLQRHGRRKAPFYHVVVCDSRKARNTGRVLETVGHYDPSYEPSRVTLKNDRVSYWYNLGARPTDSVHNIFKIGKADHLARPPSTNPQV